MDAIKNLETKMRAADFATLDDARNALKNHALLTDYALETLLRRRVLVMDEDGAVKGGALNQRKVGKESTGAWPDNWPDRDMLMIPIESAPKVLLKDIKAYLAEQGEPTGHWLCIHALRRLSAEGLVKKDGLYYFSPANQKPTGFAAIWKGVSEQARNAVRTALATCGAHAETVTSLVKADPTFAEWKVQAFSQPFVEAVRGFIAAEPQPAPAKEVAHA